MMKHKKYILHKINGYFLVSRKNIILIQNKLAFNQKEITEFNSVNSLDAWFDSSYNIYNNCRFMDIDSALNRIDELTERDNFCELLKLIK